MAFYSENQLTIYGSSQELKKFHQENKSDIDKDTLNELEPSIISFSKSVPIPNISSDKSGFNIKNWCILNWGTQLDCCGGNVVFNWKDKFEQNVALSPVILDNIIYTFWTSEYAPINWINQITKKYPEIKFELKYAEEQGGISGIFVVKDDTIILEDEDYYGKYYGSKSDKDILENMYS